MGECALLELHRRVFSTVCAVPAQNTQPVETNRSARLQQSLSTDLLAQTSDHGMIDAHQCSPQVQKVCTHHHFHEWVLNRERTKQLCIIESSPKSGNFKKGGTTNRHLKVYQIRTMLRPRRLS